LKLREFLSELGVGIVSSNCVGFYIFDGRLERVLDLPEVTAVDGLIGLSVRSEDMRRPRRLEILKLRGRDHLRGEHTLRISREGMRVIPRLEARLPAAAEDAAPVSRVAPFGVPGLDVLLGGGVAAPSSTVLAGASGAGKTLLGASFMHSGACAGEPGLLVTFEEGRQPLLTRARAVGLDLGPALERGLLQLICLPPVELEADEVAATILSQLSAMKARRLMLDDLSTFERSVPSERRHDFFTTFATLLRQAGVTSVFMQSVGTGPKGLELSPGASVLAGNLLCLHRVEVRGSLRRGLTVLKSSLGPTDWQTRELLVSERGIDLLDTLDEDAVADARMKVA
jgi:circadian clock protein KaiC